MAEETAPSWRVTGQRLSYATLDGRPAQVVVISFQTATGVAGQVTVNNTPTEYTPAHVAELINAQAEAINAIHQLQGP